MRGHTKHHLKLSGILIIRFSKSVHGQEEGRKEGTQLYVNRLSNYLLGMLFKVKLKLHIREIPNI